MKKLIRGFTIGAFTSQPIGNYVANPIDRAIKERMHCKCYLRYCDDTVGMAKTKAEAWRQVREFIRLSDEAGLVVKANFKVSKLATNEKAKKHRWRQRGRKRCSN
jgi:hypothetical protein